MHLAPSRLLTLKVLFPMATASGHLASELHVLCIDPPFLIEKQLSFILALSLSPAFWPKTATEVAFTSDIELSTFYPEPAILLERWLHFMCPVHTL